MAQAQVAAELSEQPTRRYVFELALPAVAEQFLNTLVGLADVYLLGNLTLAAAAQLGYGRVEAVAGAGLANQMVWLVTVLFMATGIGSTAMIARAKGAGDEAQMQKVLRQSVILAVIVGLIAMVVMIAMGRPFLYILHTAPDVVPRSMEYLLVVSTTIIPTSLLLVGIACLRGVGDTRTPLYVMLGTNVVNILLTWLLVSGNMGLPALGVVGAAIGTAIARGGGGLLILWLLLRGRSGLKLTNPFQVDTAILRRLTNIGAPSAGEMFVFHAALLVFVGFINSLGTVAYAAHTAIINIESISFLPGFGYAFAASTLVGIGLGAQSPAKAEAYSHEAMRQGMVMMTLIGLTMIFFPEALLSLFVDDPAVIATGADSLRAAGMIQPVLAVGFILNGALRGAGDTKWPLISRLITAWGIRLPLAWLLVVELGMGLNGIWLTMCIDFTVQALLAMWRFASGRWKTIEV
ncbi:MAG: MATE family efflux transporter [Chloroflexaceae bacterium]|nr:MATE family efflux transporter [Chloroflexaceae bacterium]